MIRFLANLKVRNKLLLGFMLCILFTIIIGLEALNSSTTLAGLTAKLYRHPYAVTNALQEANGNLLLIRVSMRDIFLADSPDEIDAALKQIETYHNGFLNRMALAKERFLGDPAAIEAIMTEYQKRLHSESSAFRW